MGFIRNIFGGFFGLKVAEFTAITNQDPHFGREIKKKGIDLTKELQQVDKLEKALKAALKAHLAQAVNKDETQALKIVDKIIADDDVVIIDAVKIGSVMIRVLREEFKEDVLAEQHGFSRPLAQKLEEAVTIRLAKLANDMEKASNIYDALASEARKSA
jgi:hypothetical protein